MLVQSASTVSCNSKFQQFTTAVSYSFDHLYVDLPASFTELPLDLGLADLLKYDFAFILAKWMWGSKTTLGLQCVVVLLITFTS